MKTFLLSTFLLILSSCFGQETKQFSYHGIYSGYVEIDPKQTDFEDIAVNLELADSVYLVNVSVRGENYQNEFRYIGLYSVNTSGKLTLKGRHPFQESAYQIRQQPLTEASTDEKRYGYKQQLTLMIHLKLNREFAEKNLKAALSCVKQDHQSSAGLFESRLSYLPEFYPDYRVLFRDRHAQDSIFSSIDSLKGSLCYSKHPKSESCNREYEYFFKVDSILFDTVYINKLLKRKNCYSDGSIDTICLYQPMKIRLDYALHRFFVGGRFHTNPDYASEVIYFQQEMDQMTHIQIMDYEKDEYGLEWIKVELDAQVFNKEAGDDRDERYFSKKVIGWTLQKNLDIN